MKLRKETEGQPHDAPTAVTCPSCAGQAEYIGAIPPSNTFAGRQLAHEIGGGGLYACTGCHLVFRHPVMDKAELNELYRSGNPESWLTPEAGRTDWLAVKDWLTEQKDVRRVLDVGCFDGRFLDYLGNGYERLGIEIHAEAAARARARGIAIVGDDFEGISTPDLGADAALAIDVIEHSRDPKAFLASLARCVRPGGFIAVTTGNSDAATWRLMGSRYWYCHIAEHIAFINPAWVAAVAPQLDLEVVCTRLFSHAEGTATLRQKAYETFANLLLRFAPWLFSGLRRLGAGGIDLQRYPGLALAPPYWMSANDHMLAVFRKRIST